MYDKTLKAYNTFLKLANMCAIISCPSFYNEYIKYCNNSNKINNKNNSESGS